jgi:hypothetical protein
VSHCPFCGKSVLPFFRKFWFWLIICILLIGGFSALLFYEPLTTLPQVETEQSSPVVIGAPEGTPYKDLALGTTVDSDSLLVTVTSVTNGLTALDGSPILAVSVQFFNKSERTITLYSTQWMMEDAQGRRVDCFIGKTDTGETIAAVEPLGLDADSQYIETFYFSGEALKKVVFLPDALSYQESDLVTWLVPPPVESSEDAENEE